MNYLKWRGLEITLANMQVIKKDHRYMISQLRYMIMVKAGL